MRAETKAREDGARRERKAGPNSLASVAANCEQRAMEQKSSQKQKQKTVQARKVVEEHKVCRESGR